MRLTIACYKIKKRNLVLINNATYQRETLSERPIRQPLRKSSYRCRRENRSTRRKPAEASMDWKPNAHMAPGLGIEPEPIGA